MLPALRLKKREDRRLRAGHLWVFSNEVDTAATPLSAFEPGQAVSIEAADGNALGTGYVNPNTLICARLVSRDPGRVLDQSLLAERLNLALALRERLFDAPYYRLAFGESDNLPGLVVDRYAGLLVAQITTAGMERLKPELLSALQEVLRPQAILLRNDSASRQPEGLPSYIEAALGAVPETVVISEGAARFEISPHTGQKTGWFYDQRINRARLRDYVRGRRVLDLFSYSGGWGINAALAGADTVLCVDSSQQAIDAVRHNAGLNHVSDTVTALKDDVFAALKTLRAERQHFEVVVLDPPALIKRKKDIKAGTVAYQRLNQAAMRLLDKDGILVSCSCSYHLEPDALRNILLRSSRALERDLQILEQGRQGPDHPVHPAIAETAYLKAMFTRSVRS